MSEETKQYPTGLEIIGLIIAAVLGVMAVEAVGLFDAADSTVAKMGMGVGAAYFFAMVAILVVANPLGVTTASRRPCDSNGSARL